MLRQAAGVFLALLLALVASPVPAQEPIPDVMIVVGPPLPVEGLEGLWAEMPVVVLATAHTASPPQLDQGRLVVRLQSFTVEEVLKDEGGMLSRDSVLVARQPGGSLVVDGRRHRTEPVEEVPLEGEEVVLFLRGPGKDGIFSLPYGYFAVAAADIVVMRGSMQSFVRLPEPRKWAKGEFLKTLRGFRSQFMAPRWR